MIMKRPKLLLATHICAGVLILASYGQQPGTPLDTPTQASVTASASQTVESGQEFEFHLQFNLPPERYGGGEIHYSFRLKSPSTDAASNQGKQIHRSIPLLDGVSAYEIKIPIDDWMPAGTWELTQIILEGGGSHSQWSIPLDGKVTFEVLPIPPVVLHLHAPGTATAGERLTWTVTIDSYPKRVRGICRSFLSANLRRIDRGEVGLHAADVPVNQIMLQQNQHTYEMSVPISPDPPAGQWAGRVRVSYGLGCSQPKISQKKEITQ